MQDERKDKTWRQRKLRTKKKKEHNVQDVLIC